VQGQALKRQRPKPPAPTLRWKERASPLAKLALPRDTNRHKRGGKATPARGDVGAAQPGVKVGPAIGWPQTRPQTTRDAPSRRGTKRARTGRNPLRNHTKSAQPIREAPLGRVPALRLRRQKSACSVNHLARTISEPAPTLAPRGREPQLPEPLRHRPSWFAWHRPAEASPRHGHILRPPHGPALQRQAAPSRARP